MALHLNEATVDEADRIKQMCQSSEGQGWRRVNELLMFSGGEKRSRQGAQLASTLLFVLIEEHGDNPPVDSPHHHPLT